MAFVSLTTITLNRFYHVPVFWYHAVRSYRAWQDRASMRKFIAHPSHLHAMTWSKGRTRGKVYHYEADALPSWAEADELLQRLGKDV